MHVADEWFLDDFAKKSFKKWTIRRPWMHRQLNVPDWVFEASTCGDNCVNFILELAKIGM